MLERLSEIVPRRIVDDDGLAVSESLDRMADVTGHDRNQTWSGDLGHAVDSYLEFALDHLIDFFLGMEVLVNRRTRAQSRSARMSCSASGNIVRASRASAQLREGCLYPEKA